MLGDLGGSGKKVEILFGTGNCFRDLQSEEHLYGGEADVGSLLTLCAVGCGIRDFDSDEEDKISCWSGVAETNIVETSVYLDFFPDGRQV